MSIIYAPTVVTSRLTAVSCAINAGPTGGFIVLGTKNMAATVASVKLNNPCGTVAGNVLTFTGLPLSAPLTYISGYIESAIITDSLGNQIASGLTVGNSTAYDIVMNTNLVSSGQTVALTYATITGT